jgi:hypothetical protein
MLVQRSGELVTREELRKKLWPEDTFVDFDHSLNTAINKIREAPGDSAENPHKVDDPPSPFTEVRDPRTRQEEVQKERQPWFLHVLHSP